jgi:hypothetical protein
LHHLAFLRRGQAAEAVAAALPYPAAMEATEDFPQVAAVVAAQLRPERHQAEAGMAAQEWQLLQPIFKYGRRLGHA